MDQKPYPAEKARGGEIILYAATPHDLSRWVCSGLPCLRDHHDVPLIVPEVSLLSLSERPERSPVVQVCRRITDQEKNRMTRSGIFGATALSLSLIVAAPALAQEAGGRAAAHVNAGAGMRASGGNVGGPRMGGAPQANFRSSAQANVGRANFAAGRNAQLARTNPRIAEGDRGVLGGGQFRDDRGRGFRRGAGFAVGAAAAGVATGAAIAAGDYGYGYGPDYYGYGDDYAYDAGYSGDSYAFDNGPAVAFDQPVVGDASFCAQRYRSYDPASGTYLGFDGLRHPCP